MYRINCDDWDRKKTYLIRSLFHDLPLLSPVYESRESSCSPSGVMSRPGSPLPPLIIEKMTNPHDEPPEYYDELERKMKKVYRKLLFNEDSISVDSLLARYSGDVTYGADQIENRDEVVSSETNDTDDNNNFVTAIEANNISRSVSSVQNQSKEYDTETTSNDDNPNNGVAIDNDNVNNVISYEEDTQSTSDDALVNTQITIKATVHRSPSYNDEDTNIEQGTISTIYEREEVYLSPLLVCRGLVTRKTQAVETGIEIAADSNERLEYDRESSDQDQVSQNKSVEDEEVEENEVTSENTAESISNDTIEAMRRQRSISPSLGSLQDPEDNYFDITRDKNVDFNRRTSYEIHSDSQNSPQKAITDRNTETFPDDDFSNILTTPLKGKRRRMSSKRLIDDFNTANLEFVTKRLKAKEIGVQAMIFSDENENSDWDYLKTNFFVGVPKVYKLCICKNHFCREE